MFKDTDDIRENIINYEDEGGGEGDMEGYNLDVLRSLVVPNHPHKHHIADSKFPLYLYLLKINH